ncbi:alpha/beta hydrolase [Amycolatopsis sp. NPDC051372]|uniref:alpha/beta fold hydrolase n=1 Tax=unclassified Amycolatopsis TaxID=2618356 RepID=UPI0034378014
MANYLLVHAAWCDGSMWRHVAADLRLAGHDARVIDQLPSVGDEPGALGDLYADAAYLRSILDSATEDVVLVGHSYGGMVITEVADHPRIQHSVYLAAFWPKKGETLLDIRSAHPHEWLVPHGEGALRVTDDMAIAQEIMGADLGDDYAEFHRNLRLQSRASFTCTSNAPARTHPTSYVVCEQDRSIFVADQERMSTAANIVTRIDAAHMAPLSRPEAVTAELLRSTSFSAATPSDSSDRSETGIR